MAGVALVPVRGGKAHSLRPSVRPMPVVGDQAVWPTECGRVVFGNVKDWQDIDQADRCKRCAARAV